MKLSKVSLFTYLREELTGRLIGFVVGMWTSQLLSGFFETRGLKNLWGLRAKKTIIDKQTYEILDWTVSIVIGFVVFEIIQRIIKNKHRLLPMVQKTKNKILSNLNL
ncbi:MAG: hypothetical protein ACK40G_02015 [Cytophagaceae bacterium]